MLLTYQLLSITFQVVCGCRINSETMLRLADHPNIIGVKECTSLANMAYLIEHKPEEFLVYTG